MVTRRRAGGPRTLAERKKRHKSKYGSLKNFPSRPRRRRASK